MKFIGLARIGNQPEIRYTSASMAVLQLSLAYDYGREKQTQWINASLFGKRAEAIAPHLVKGQLLYVEISDLHISSYQNKEGKEVTSLKGIVQDLKFTGKEKRPEEPAKQKQSEPTSLGGMDDDIPW